MNRYERWKNGESIKDIVASGMKPGGCRFSWSGNGEITTTFCNEPRDTASMCQKHYGQVYSKAAFPGMGNW